ncbi:MAG TPA: LUD domain-containing protein [Humidesulfovibrio sp.]|uniref:L-lactate dehydrogenase (quinone) large subunit LdhH n=1 Tax=Humidesulfovibrio sp. TaxID=2910988 RepID=UPI002D021092|nr:LUD domain-containing protein [Humidesulfovibrio sp.]HWR02915.1 LUD domain-containing protein [Humidesulfovibrio sp.]
MQNARDLKQYKGELTGALHNDFLRQAMDKFAVAYRASRANAFAGMDVDGLIAEIAAGKDEAMAHMDELLAEFTKKAEALGVTVHVAKTAHEANEIIGKIAQKANVKRIVKSKSMTAEETLLNHHLEDLGLEVTETDLGEWIIQLRHEGPTHMVMPAIHLSRDQVADLFSDVTGAKQTNDIQKLVKVARRELRRKYVEADMGISGGNFAIAETGSIALCTNEGNARLVTTLPRVHVALVGLDKLTRSINDALRVIRALPKNATGQAITSYVSWITGPGECQSSANGKKEMHVVFLDNGRRALAKDPVFSQVLRCIRCGACANVCPVYRLVGGHQLGHIYIGAIGLILTYFYHGRDKAKNLVQNCINCGACKAVCAGGIDLPRLIKEVHARIQDEEGHPLQSQLLAKVLKSRKLFHALLRSAKAVQRPVTGGTPYLRHLPMIFAKDQGFRALPAIAETPFRDRFESLKPKVTSPKLRVALFSGCVQDFVYPEQAEAAVKILAKHNVAVEFPMDQSCCGLPVQMMGERESSRSVAAQNVAAFDPAACDYILTLCASCASHLKHGYPDILAGDPKLAVKVQQFADKVIDFSSFVHDVLKVQPESFAGDGKKTTYHAPCHLCRGLGVTKAPRALMEIGGLNYLPAEEEDVCCGFGGTYSMKFPELSAELLKKKLANAEKTGAELLLTDCPGCIMQLRGGLEAKGSAMKVAHVAEALAERLK